MKKAKPGRRQLGKKRPAASRDVDEYIAGVPEAARDTLEEIRSAIRSALPPEATETISYRIPAFKSKGVLVWFAAFANHCSFFPTAAVVERFQDELAAFATSKGTIRFPLDQPPPRGLIKRLVKARVAQAAARERR